MHLAHYLGLLHKAQVGLAAAFREVGDGHREEPDVFYDCEKLAKQCDEHAERLKPFADRYAKTRPTSPNGCIPTCSQGRAAAASACCATCRTSI